MKARSAFENSCSVAPLKLTVDETKSMLSRKFKKVATL
jgi:hypothetical protein